MRLFFWSSERLMPLYGWLALGFIILAPVLSLLSHRHAPEWATSGLILLLFVTWVVAALRSAFGQARDNAKIQIGTSRPQRPKRRATYDAS
jgi:hypothetical protein